METDISLDWFLLASKRCVPWSFNLVKDGGGHTETGFNLNRILLGGGRCVSVATCCSSWWW